MSSVFDRFEGLAIRLCRSPRTRISRIDLVDQADSLQDVGSPAPLLKEVRKLLPTEAEKEFLGVSTILLSVI